MEKTYLCILIISIALGILCIVHPTTLTIAAAIVTANLVAALCTLLACRRKHLANTKDLVAHFYSEVMLQAQREAYQYKGLAEKALYRLTHSLPNERYEIIAFLRREMEQIEKSTAEAMNDD